MCNRSCDRTVWCRYARIVSLVAAAIDVGSGNIQRAFGITTILDIDRDAAADGALDVTAAEDGVADSATMDFEQDTAFNVSAFGCSASRSAIHIVEGTAVHDEVDIAWFITSLARSAFVSHVSFLAAAIEVVDVHVLGASDCGVNVTDEIGILATAVELGDVHILAARDLVDGDVGGAGDGTVLVTAGEERANRTAVDFEVNIARNVGRADFTVTATEHFFEATALDGGVHVGCLSRITATEQTLDGVVAAEDVHVSRLIASRIVGSVTTAEHIGDGISPFAIRSVIDLVGVFAVSSVDIYRHIILRRAAGIVTAIDVTANGSIAKGGRVVGGIQGSGRCTDVDKYLTVHLALCGVTRLAQTAAKDVAT